jgi:hypothetical protein
MKTAARAADPGGAAAAKAAGEAAMSRHMIPGAFAAYLTGALSFAIAVAVQPQAGGGLVRAGAVLLRIFYGAGGAASLLVGTVFLYSALRDRRITHHQDYRG